MASITVKEFIDLYDKEAKYKAIEFEIAYQIADSKYVAKLVQFPVHLDITKFITPDVYNATVKAYDISDDNHIRILLDHISGDLKPYLYGNKEKE